MSKSSMHITIYNTLAVYLNIRLVPKPMSILHQKFVNFWCSVFSNYIFQIRQKNSQVFAEQTEK